MPLCPVEPADLLRIREGKQIPRSYLGCLQTSPSLEDYALTSEESVIAKEVVELPEVLEYIEEHNLEGLILEELPEPDLPSVPILETIIAPTTMEQEETIGEQPDSTTKKETPRGITKGVVINAFEGLHFNRDQWAKYLASPPKWLEECRVARGNKKTSATWNPVLIAVALYDKKISINKLDAVFVTLPNWADEWHEISESFR